MTTLQTPTLPAVRAPRRSRRIGRRPLTAALSAALQPWLALARQALMPMPGADRRR